MMPPRHPPQAALRRAEAAAWGQRPAPVPLPSATPRTMKIKKFTPFRNEAGTVLGFLSIQTPSGMIVNDAKLMIGPKGRRWIAMPSLKQLDRDGNPRLDAHRKPMWSPIIEFVDRATADRFGEMILLTLRSQYPDLFEGEP
jgi:hypothetical protein